jgi:hypothetical protein
VGCGAVLWQDCPSHGRSQFLVWQASFLSIDHQPSLIAAAACLSTLQRCNNTAAVLHDPVTDIQHCTSAMALIEANLRLKL